MVRCMNRGVLVALGLTSPWRDVLDEAVSLADLHHSRLTILTVVPVCHGISMGEMETQTAARDATADLLVEGQALLRAARDHVPLDLPVTTVMRRGSAARMLMAELRDGDYRAVVIGAGRARGRTRLLRPSLSVRIARRSPVPVVVVASKLIAADASAIEDVGGADRSALAPT
jgi:nucleotide-binding universal stress UspA family protein